MNQLVQRQLETKIGQIECKLLSDQSSCKQLGKEKYENGESDKYQTEGHQIELVEFKSRTHEFVKDSKCWIFRITKINDVKERLRIKCEITNQNSDVEFDTAAGEHLDAIRAYNKEWQIYVGTEDGEMLFSRAEKNAWFPERLKNKVNFYKSITTYLKGNNGLQTEIPELENGEKIHIQYLSSVDLNSNKKINGWHAVDDFKENLENWIGIS